MNSSVNLTRMDSDGKNGNNTNNSNKKSMDLLTPEMTPEEIWDWVYNSIPCIFDDYSITQRIVLLK